MYGIGNDAFGGQGNQGDAYDYGDRLVGRVMSARDTQRWSPLEPEPTGDWQAGHP
jgi:hypothetical protein